MNKIFVIFIVLIILGGIVFGLRFFLGGPEDDWICEKGQWIKHGNPSAPQPTEDCEITWEEIKDLIMDCQVREVGQTHSRDVWIYLKDDTMLAGTEPHLDDILTVTESAKEKCGPIDMLSE